MIDPRPICVIARSVFVAAVLMSLLAHWAIRAAVGETVAEVRRFRAPEATQAVAVDDRFFYAIDNAQIAKYSKDAGERQSSWHATKELPLKHLNSGIAHDGRLYCAHSNFPEFPSTSSVEIWDTESLQHVDSHSFGIYEGSLTWIDRRDDTWWAVFAHYTKRVNDDPTALDARWTSLVQFDSEWRRTAAWVFPRDVIDRFEPHSCSGAAWGENGLLYCTGHDRGELYELALPKAGSTLRRRRTFEVPLTGQGFAFDPSQPDTVYGIDRRRREVAVIELGEHRGW